MKYLLRKDSRCFKPFKSHTVNTYLKHETNNKKRIKRINSITKQSYDSNKK